MTPAPERVFPEPRAGYFVHVNPAGSATDIAVIGGGAAGLAAAIFAARQNPRAVIVVLDGAKKLGAKILVSGGGRCNVTNQVVTPADFCGGSPHVIRKVLGAFSVAQTVAFFREFGVELHAETHGKLFPNSNNAHTVLNALLNEAQRRGVRLLAEHRVTGIERRVTDIERALAPGAPDPNRDRQGAAEPVGSAVRTNSDRATLTSAPRTDSGFAISMTVDSGAAARTAQLAARRIILATGGRSLPKTGSDGSGYALAQRLGHTLVPTTPALVPLVLDGDFHKPLSGIAHDVELTISAAGAKPTRLRGALLWTHFGVSGPVVLNASRHWLHARSAGATLSANFLPDETFDSAERKLLDLATAQPKLSLKHALAALIHAQPGKSHYAPEVEHSGAEVDNAGAQTSGLPARVGAALLDVLEIDAQTELAHLARDTRRRLIHALRAWPLPVRDSRGYTHAEVTAGGVPLSEIDPATLASRRCPGLYLVGEILDVDGRIGGFNFQWAWSSGFVAGRAAARALSEK